MHRTARGTSLRRIGAALLAVPAIACAGGKHREPTVLAKVPERVVILPFNVATAMPAELKADSPAVWTALETYLRSQGSQLKTLAFPTARMLWAASVKEAQAEPNETRRGAAVGRAFVAKLKPYAEFDAVIFPSLFIQRAALSGTQATWDGTEQTLEINTGVHGAPVPPDAAIEGAAPAASLHVVVLDPQGEQIQESQAGIALLVSARVSYDPVSAPSYSFVPRKDPFADPAVLRDAVARALAPFISAPSAGEHRPSRRDRDRR
ncbi:MAG: hypothetical protein E6J87_19115 [Deltaproteobacteria bacterium]|nr:MAG: hypothetical protein E6J87_19115 [Deltaproteobacteria bacterium]